MSNQKFSLDFGLLRIGFFTTILLAIFKLTDVADINIWVVFMPFLVALGILFICVFIIGLIAVYILSTHGIDVPDEGSEEGEE